MSTKSLKPTKPPISPLPPSSRSPSLINHLATIELKQRILNSLSRLSDRDTHQIAVDDLETIIKTISPDAISFLLNSLYAATSTTATNNNAAVRKEAIRLLSVVCAIHTESTATHLSKIIAHIVKTLKDSDSGVKDSCRESIGHLSFLYLKGDNNIGSVVSLFVKPLFDAMNEQNKGVQSGAAMCMAKMVDMASDPPILSFQKLCGRIYKLLNSPNFLANSALLPVVSSLSQVGAISPQFLEPLLQTIHDCLSSSDWSTRKAAADTLNALALHSSNLIKEKPTPTISILEACRFDKIKPVRDSITEALQLWKFIAEDLQDQNTPHHCQDSELAKPPRKYLPMLDDKRVEIPIKDGQTKGQNVSKKSTGTKKKAPPLSDKELNPEFFQRLERRVSGEVEVIVNGRFIKSSDLQNEEETEVNDNDGGEKSKSKPKSKSEESYQPDEQVNLLDRSSEREGDDLFSRHREFDKKGNLLGIQRQLLQLERQQAHLMNMLQDFKGGSRDGMATLENRVWGLERVVEDMARNLSVSMNTLRRSGYINGFHESSERSFSKYKGFSNYPNTKLVKNDDGLPYMGRGSSWDYHTHGLSTEMGSRRGVNSRSPKRVRPVRFGEAHVGDMDMAFGEALASGDDLLLLKLMDKTGPLIDQLSSDVASEVFHAVARFLLEPNLFDICLSWIQQLLDMIIENGKDVVGIPLEVKREILVNLNEASSTTDPPENWEGLMPDQLLLQLASAWHISLQQLYK